MLVQVLDFVACHVWVKNIHIACSIIQTWHAMSLHSSGNGTARYSSW